MSLHELPASDGRCLILPRFTQPEPDQRVLLKTLALRFSPIVVVRNDASLRLQPSKRGAIAERPGFSPCRLADDTLERRDKSIFHVLVRLQPGVTPQRVEAELDTMARQIEQGTHDAGRHRSGRRITLLPGGKLMPTRREGLPGYCAVLGGIILLIASANVANMLLARAAERRKEIALRLAIGASRARLVRQLLAECALIAAGAGVLGILGATSLTKSASVVELPFPVPLHFYFSPDARVLGFTFALTAFTALAFGLAPAVQATGAGLTSGLKEGGNVVSRRLRRLSLRNLLVISQVAGSLALLLITGFLVIEPILLFGAPAQLAFLALLCCYLPARKSTRIDPAVTLRAE